MYTRRVWLLLVLLIGLIPLALSSASASNSQPHSNNWAVLVCTSRYWFNYRHMANTMSMYRTVKRLGIPDSQIILMLADDAACNARNMYPGTIFANANRALDLYGEAVEVDYRGEEVSVENFIRLLTDRVSTDTPISKRLNTNERSNIFVYMTGHGGDEFLKFQDSEEISAFDIADAFQSMWTKNRYNEIFFMIDTCQANTMFSKFYSPNIIATGSSEKGQNSYSHHADPDIGVAVIDRFTHAAMTHLEHINKTSQAKLVDLFATYDPDSIRSTPGVRTDLFKSRSLEQVLLTDFFGGVSDAELVSADTTPARADQPSYPARSKRAPRQAASSQTSTHPQEMQMNIWRTETCAYLAGIIMCLLFVIQVGVAYSE